MPIVIDGHLDLAYNVLGKGRDLTLELEELRRRERRSQEEAMVTLPELRRAGVKIVFATVFVLPRASAADAEALSYATPAEARAQAVEQLELYQRWEEAGLLRIVRWRSDLDAHLEAPDKDLPVGAVLLMEGADPLGEPGELGWWFDRGLRILGPAWKGTRYAGGTDAPGPLTAAGVELIEAVKETGVILDVSHLAEESFWQALELGAERVLASHSNARSLVASDRQLSDAMIAALAERDAVIGLVLANIFLKAGVSRSDPKSLVTLDDVRRQAEHVAGLVGWRHLGIGSDFDGGFVRQEVPSGLERGADFSRLGHIAPPEAAAGLLGENWLRLLRQALPDDR